MFHMTSPFYCKRCNCISMSCFHQIIFCPVQRIIKLIKLELNISYGYIKIKKQMFHLKLFFLKNEERKLCFIIYFIVIFLMHSCSPEKPKTFHEKDYEKYKEFLTRFLFLESAAYTLHGTKPITEIILDRRTEEEKEILRKKYFEKHAEIPKEQINNMPRIDFEPKFSFEETWDLWKKYIKKLSMKKYLFVCRKGKGEVLAGYEFIYFVNIPETAKIIQKHYDLFRKYIGKDFDVLETVFEFKNENSSFWNKIFAEESSPEQICLLGILFGYGIENSYEFSWYFLDKRNAELKDLIDSIYSSQIKKLSLQPNFKNISATCFPLPGFISFSAFDFNIKKYEEERNKIIELYKRQDIVEFTIKTLCE